jgi:transcriptional/translational regulatory protein YebC/TACO1
VHGAGLKLVDMYLGMRAKQTVAPEGRELAAALAFLDLLEEHEDVQHVFSNLDVSDAALEALF